MVRADIKQSDKFFWHRYVDFYEPYFAALDEPKNIVEFGVFHGDSIRYLAERFPSAEIVGCDILQPQHEWPTGDRIRYAVLDQNDPAQIEGMFRALPTDLDMVIEDGSHDPIHQRYCLVASLPRIRSGGIYILEDLHTSQSGHPLAQQPTTIGRLNSYNLLLAFEHFLSTDAELKDYDVEQLSTTSLFSAGEIRELFDRVAAVAIYHRSTLPLRCWSCASTDFDYATIKCKCGGDLMSDADSIAAVITIK